MAETGTALTEQASCIHIRRQEVTVSGQRPLWRETRHVGRLHDMVEVLSWIPADPTKKPLEPCAQPQRIGVP